MFLVISLQLSSSFAPIRKAFVDYLLGYELAVIRGPTKFHDAILAEFCRSVKET